MRLLVAETTRTAKAAASDLSRIGFLVTRADCIETCLDFLMSAEQDALLLDDLTNDTIERTIASARQSHPLLPIVVLSEGADKARRKILIAAGADHIVHDSFNPTEIAHRIHAMVRRSAGYPGPGLDTGGLLLDPMTRNVTTGKGEIRLARLEYEVLEMLALRAGRHVDRDAIMTQLYAWTDEPEAAIVEVYLSRIRRKIAEAGGDPGMIETAPGRGWRMRTGMPDTIAA